ncbi:hypothetical protein E3P96_03330 [Wallemia ichthyophaga]|nr:hypothetical protein E3P96_03330 [Wallemia ichthyophaga]
MEIKLVDKLIYKLEDNNIEIKEFNLKVLVELVNKVRFVSLNHLILNLLDTLKASNTQELKDIHLICLKGVIKHSNRLALLDSDWFINNIISILDIQTSIDLLDVLHIYINKTPINDNQRSILIKTQFNFITSSNSRHSMKKKSISLLTTLLNSNHLDTLNTFIDKNLSSNFIITTLLIQNTLHLINTPTHIDQIINQLNNQDDDIKDAALSTLDCYVSHLNPQSHITQLISISQSLINYNPNYFDLDEDDEEDDQDDEDEEDEPLSDNDDLSWKVRKSAAKLLTTIIASNSLLLSHLYSTLFIHLLTVTSKEREESVKLELFNAINAFFVVSAAVAQKSSLKRKHNEMDVDITAQCDLQSNTYKSPLINSLTKHLSDKSLIIRLNSYKLLTTLIQSMPDILQAPYIDEIAPLIQQGLNNVESTISSGLPIEVLTMLNTLFETHTYRSIQHSIPAFTHTLINTTKLTKYHKLSSLAFKSLSNLVILLRPNKEDGLCSPSPIKQTEINELIKLIALSTTERIQDSDLSNNVKDDAIDLISVLLSHSGDILVQSDNDTNVLHLLKDRTYNNLNRFSGIKAIQSVAASRYTCTNEIFTQWLTDCVKLITPLIKQNDRVIKMAAFECLEVLLERVADRISKDVVAELVDSILPLVNINDINTLSHTLNMATKLFSSNDLEIRSMVLKILNRSYSLIKSPVLIIEPLESFYQVASRDGGLSAEIISRLLNEIGKLDDKELKDVGGEGEHILDNVSRLIGGVIVESGNGSGSGVEQFVNLVKSPNQQISDVYLSLLVVGHVGKHFDLSQNYPHLFKDIQTYFTHSEDKVRRSSSCSLGSICVGSSTFLPQLLDQLRAPDYLILLSLKEVISGAELSSNDADTVFDTLLCGTNDENVRNIAAECLAKLLYKSETYVPHLKQVLQGGEENKKLVIVIAIRYAISEAPHENSLQLDDLFSTFTALLAQQNLEVIRITLSTINSAARHKPQLISEGVINNLLTQTTVNTQLVRQITLGPFKETIDDGLPIRKTAFECLYTMSNHSELVSARDLIEQVKKGLGDVDEIKILSYLILNRLVSVCGDLLSESLNDILPCLQKTLQHKPKDNATKMEHERNTELQSSVCRTMATLNGSSLTNQHGLLINLIKTVIEPNPTFKTVFLASSQLHLSTTNNSSEAMQID